MTIENIGQFMGSGNLEQITQNGRSVENTIAKEIPNHQNPFSNQTEAGAGSRSFTQMLSESMDKVNEIQLQADHAAKELIAGRNKNIHETMLMIEKADMSFRLMMQVRNKVIDAYKEIMRMQI